MVLAWLTRQHILSTDIQPPPPTPAPHYHHQNKVQKNKLWEYRPPRAATSFTWVLGSELRSSITMQKSGIPQPQLCAHLPGCLSFSSPARPARSFLIQATLGESDREGSPLPASLQRTEKLASAYQQRPFQDWSLKTGSFTEGFYNVVNSVGLVVCMCKTLQIRQESYSCSIW